MTPATVAAVQKSFKDKLQPSPTKKLLALDGGGIRGLISVEILAKMEALLREKTGNSELVLADYFDYIAGTSTGAIVATCLSMGMSTDQVRTFYEANGEAMFDKSHLIRRFRYKYEDDKLAAKLQEVLRTASKSTAHPTLGTEALRTLLLVIMRNATTDSPWPITNNPSAKYNAPGTHNCNLNIPLWQLVRASTAAPTYFPPEEVKVGDHSFLFVDGGVTTYNNPAFLLFLMATMGAYNLRWPTGADKMLLMSVGTGTSPHANIDLNPSDMNLLYNAGSIPSALMYAALNEQDLLCRAFGACRHGAHLDREVEDLIDTTENPGRGLLPKLFSYARYNVELSRENLDQLGLKNIEPKNVQQLDSIKHMDQLKELGRKVAEGVKAEHFDGF